MSETRLMALTTCALMALIFTAWLTLPVSMLGAALLVLALEIAVIAVLRYRRRRRDWPRARVL